MFRPELLLLPNIPKPLHGVNPRSILGKRWWDDQRTEAYAKMDYHCHACGVHLLDAKYHRWLEGHEVYETHYVEGRLVYIETVALCHSCHNFIHSGRLKQLYIDKKINKDKFLDILQHGKKVLGDNLKPPKPYTGPMAEWGDWRLILRDNAYPPIYRTFKEWRMAYIEEDETVTKKL